jgi:ribosomal protein L32
VVKKKTKRTSSQRKSNRLTKDDMQALNLLDHLVEEDRRIEQKYSLPFRSPRQVATSLQQCTHCGKDIALLIFGDLAMDAAGLEAYGRLTEDLIKQKDLPTYIIAPPSDTNDLDSPALLLKVYPEQGKPGLTTPPEWEALIRKLSDEHCKPQ